MCRLAAQSAVVGEDFKRSRSSEEGGSPRGGGTCGDEGMRRAESLGIYRRYPRRRILVLGDVREDSSLISSSKADLVLLGVPMSAMF